MALFDIPNRTNKADDIAIVQKLKTKKQVQTRSSNVLDKVEQIRKFVNDKLGKFKDDYICIQDIAVLQNYINVCIENSVISIDTETSGLDPLLDELVGICIYTPDMPAGYIPLHHISYVSGQLVENQLDKSIVRQELARALNNKVDVIMFNAKFDIRFLRNQLGLKNIYCTWDCYLASRLMNENEPKKGLKALHQKYILNDEEDEFSFSELFNGIEFSKIPIQSAYLYAAHDAIITYELYQFQKQYLRLDHEREDLRNVAWVFFNIEMPCVSVVCDMEDNGIELDMQYAKQLSETYNQKLKDCEKLVQSEIDKYNNKIIEYKKRHTNHKLDTPINFNSTTQLAILLYDILQITPPDKKSPRGTGVEILTKIDNPICKAVLDYRAIKKLLSTYIDKLPNCVNPNDGRIHCSFNQYGADTGRFSSSDPNLQNIPSHNKDIRKMFKATDGYVLMSSDYSQQEPRSLAALCKKQGDAQMYNTFMQGKDLYSEIASKAFNKPYAECKEFNADGTTNRQGKERRTQAKSILLGVLYGRGEKSIGEQLGCSEQKAKEIKDSVFKGFPAIKQFEQDSLRMAYEKGYVTTVCGRKRRLPDLQLDEFEFKSNGRATPNEDLLDFEEQRQSEVQEVCDELISKYTVKLRNARFGEKRKIFEEANKEGIWIVDNGGKIADAQRQCVNARIQGSAADLTKLAMIDLGNNKRLKELGFRLLIPVHDEVIAECPEENVKECSQLLSQVMSKAAEKILEMPIGCDVEITKNWYGEKIAI